MINKELKQEIISLKVLHDIVETYEEIAAMRMRKIKSSVLVNRSFLNELNQVYLDVENNKQVNVAKKVLIKQIEAIKNIIYDKKLYILLSANAGLYGAVVRDTIRNFILDIRDQDCDVIIIGKIGKGYYEKEQKKHKYTYFDYSDDVVDEAKAADLLKEIVKYREVVIYYGLFKDILTQIPQKSVLSHGTIEKHKKEVLEEGKRQLASSGSSSDRKKYLLEPSSEALLDFFEKEVMRLLFIQYLYESNLSKFASRMINLDYAIVNVNTRLKQMNYLRLKNKHRLADSKQQNVLSGISLWS